jgi:2-methylcitrate dehydratase PrpD
MGPTETLAQFVVDTRLRDIPAQAIANSKLVILDVLGVTLAASTQAIARILNEYLSEAAAARQAGVIGSPLRTEPALAAWANGALAFALDFDDNIHGSTHTVAAALAIGEGNGAGGVALLEAYILGRDICFRLDAALDAGRRKNLGGPTTRGWFAGGTTGSLAAAAAAGKVLGLNAKQLATAFGIAVAGAGGVRRNFGTMAKALQTGNAARNGVTAALLAKKGFSADPAIIEAPMGFASALCLDGECDWPALTKDLGKFFHMEEMPPIKRFPTCTPAHRPIEGLLALRQQHRFGADDVEIVECDFHLRSLSRSDPQEVIAGPNSMPFILAIALLDGKVTLEQFTDEKIHDPRVRAVMAKIEHRPNAHQPGQPEPADRITVTLKNGASHTIEVAQRTTLTGKSDIEAKFMGCATLALSSERARRLADLVDDLENLADVSTVMACMNGNGLKTSTH